MGYSGNRQIIIQIPRSKRTLISPELSVLMVCGTKLRSDLAHPVSYADTCSMYTVNTPLRLKRQLPRRGSNAGAREKCGAGTLTPNSVINQVGHFWICDRKQCEKPEISNTYTYARTE